MKKKPALPHPCALDWEALADRGNDKFCHFCGKIITDFSQYSDTEIYDWFRKYPERSCGFFLPSQIRTRRYHTWQHILGRAAVFLAGFAAFSHPVFSKYSSHEKIEYRISQPIKGTVVADSKGSPHAFARINLKSGKSEIMAVSCDENGRFGFTLPAFVGSGMLEIIIESTDSKTRLHEFIPAANISVYLNRAILLEPDKVFKPRKPKKGWGIFKRSRHIFRRRMGGAPQF